MAQDLTGEYAIKQGATYRATIIWKTGATVATALPVNLTGYHARCMFKSTAVKKASLVQAITKANPGVVTTQEAHKLKTGQSVVLPGVGGMVEILGTTRYTITVTTPTAFTIATNTSGYTPYTAGGTVNKVNLGIVFDVIPASSVAGTVKTLNSPIKLDAGFSTTTVATGTVVFLYD